MVDPERIWKIVENNRLNVPKKNRQPGASLSLFDRLYDCYVECIQNAADKTADKRFRGAVNLLKHINPAHAKPSLIVSLHPDEKGYSLTLCPNKDGESEEIFLPYEDNEIFSYLDNQEIPPVVLEVVEKTQHCYMYNGCMICEVRDYRNSQSSSNTYERHLLLLRPTTETLLNTVNELAHETRCSSEEKLFLESRLLLATQPPICLDPSTDVLCVTNRLQYNRRKFHSHAVRRYLRRRSHAWRARMHMSSRGKAPDSLKLHDFISEKHKDSEAQAKRDFSNLWTVPRMDFTMPENIDRVASDVAQLARVLPQSQAELEQLQQYTKPQPPLGGGGKQGKSAVSAVQSNVFEADYLLNSQNSEHRVTPQVVAQPKPHPPPQQATPPPTKTLAQAAATLSTPTNLPQQVLISAAASGMTFGNLQQLTNQQAQQLTNQQALLNQLFQQQQQSRLAAAGKPNRPIAPAPPQLHQQHQPGIKMGPVVGSPSSLSKQRLKRLTAVGVGGGGGVTSKSPTPGSAVVLLPRTSGQPGSSVVQVSTLTPATPPLKRPPVPGEIGVATSAALTPPKLRPPVIPPPIAAAQAGAGGMPRLHPLATEAPSILKPPPLQMSPSSSPQTVAKIISSGAPTMPQLHKMPTTIGGGDAMPPMGRVSHTPPLKPSPTIIRMQSQTKKSTKTKSSKHSKK